MPLRSAVSCVRCWDFLLVVGTGCPNETLFKDWVVPYSLEFMEC